MTSIFVAKLDFNTSDEELKSLFEKHGKVNRVTIAKDRETGKPRGFAFVEMANEAEADAAIDALDESEINGRTIAVKKADDRGKPGGAPSGDRPPRTDRPFTPGAPRGDTPYRKPDDSDAPRPAFNPETNLQKVDRKKEKEKFASGGKDKPKVTKMPAFKKSGKANRFLDDDDDDFDLDEPLNLYGDDEEE